MQSLYSLQDMMLSEQQQEDSQHQSDMAEMNDNINAG